MGKSSKSPSATLRINKSKKKEKSFFDPVNPKVDFPKMERDLLDYWYKKEIDKKYIRKNNNSKKHFSFFDGPITANNPMGVHHAWGRTLKDVWLRYKNMQGFRQRFQNGFDCQGLWVEVEVEKDLGFKTKKDIEKHGLDKFSNACKKRVDKYSNVQTTQSKRLGQFMDWENSYYTFTDKNIEYIWYFLKVCHKKGWLYKGFRSLPWCGRCGTSLSQHELTDSYKEMVHKSVFLKFPLTEKENSSFLVWTTTPWTLTANVALAVNPSLDYVQVEEDNELFILAKDMLGVLKGRHKIIKKIKGKDLLGMKYKGPFDELLVQKKSQRVIIPWEGVSEAEGTGVVHIAPGCGAEDFELGRIHNLEVIVPLDENGLFYKGFGDLSRKYAHNIDDFVFGSLKKKKILYKIKNYKHSYPTCWRCKVPIVFRAEENWFISADEIRPKMIKEVRKVKWHPEYVGKLMEDWLNNMGDWNISRKRYYGLPLPFYECKCEDVTIVGSLDELRKLSTRSDDVDKLPELHRPWIDDIKIKCSKCNQEVKRILDVGDCWLDAGIVPFSTLKYLENRSYWEKWFPADWISEMREQVRLWFYSMMFMSVTLEARTPYKEVLSYEKVYDEKGNPMHKSEGNAIWFDDAVDKMGADVMRWMYVRHNVSDNLLFGYKTADETRRRFHLKLWNVYSFFVNYANLDKWQPDYKGLKPVEDGKLKVENNLDRWILCRLKETLDTVEKGLNGYDANIASEAIEKFVNDLSNWYIRRSRDRVGPVAEDQKDKESFYNTCYLTLVTLSQILAPFLPFISETLYRNLVKRESVHLSDWPKIDVEVDRTLLEDMHNIRLVAEVAHAIRKEKQIPVRQPLSLLNSTINFNKPDVQLVKYLLDEINIKKWDVKKGSTFSNKFDTNITPELKEEAETRLLIRKIQSERRNMGLNLTQKTVVVTPWLPKSNKLLQLIMKKTSTVDIRKGDTFKLQKTS